jgi:hypothetical protein
VKFGKINMMTLKEAIEHCKEKAQTCDNKECALDHFQLFKWLKEYQSILEKQGEQKPIDPDTLIQQRVDELADIAAERIPVDKVEPKFKVGDWVICIKNFSTPGFDFKSGEVLRCTGSNEIGLCGMTASDLDNFRFWTIQDAKDGDVLYDGNNACLFRKKMEDDDAIWVDTYCGINSDGMFNVNNEDECWCLACDCTPATKGQRDTLEKAITDAGYAFDFDKKELKKIKQDSTDRFFEGFKKGEQSVIENYGKYGLCKPTDKVEPKWKPTDKDIFELQCVINNVPYNGFILKALLEQLKKLKEE